MLRRAQHSLLGAHRLLIRRRNVLLLYLVVVFFLTWILLGCSNPISQFRRQTTPLKVHVVLSTTSYNDYSWTSQLTLQDYETIPYIVDNPEAEYHVPANKGNEAMGYLTYMFEFYDKLPDIAVFLHGQEMAWHVDGVLNHNMTETLNRLDLSEIIRRKHVNLRISWDNACPIWMNTSITFDSPEYYPDWKSEEPYMKGAFETLFPGNPVPEAFGVPCCSQFAVSRDAIRSVPREWYYSSIGWLQNGTLPNNISGRIWEHLWQWLYLQKAVDCPPEHATLCRLYHICFDTSTEWAKWKDMEMTMYDGSEKLGELMGQAQKDEQQISWLQNNLTILHTQLDAWRDQAILNGQSEKVRRKIAEAEPDESL